MTTMRLIHTVWQALRGRLPQHLLTPPGPYIVGTLATVASIALLVGVVGPTAPIRQMNLGFAILFWGVLIAYMAGAAQRAMVYTANIIGLLYLIASALTDGHLYASTLAWLPLIPLTFFYIVGWRAGRLWMLLMALVHGLMALLAWHWGEYLPRLQGQDLAITVRMGLGKGRATIWTCDLTKAYVEINGDYRS